jgi:Mlc titration factor MtfA (ptsG expression regulator)
MTFVSMDARVYLPPRATSSARTWYAYRTMFGLFKTRRRAALREEPMPAAWHATLMKNVPYASLLGTDDLHTLEALVRVFIAEKHFEGCGGITITDEMKVTIAAQACLLLLHRESDVYPDLESILVYPHAYRAQSQRRDGAVVVEADDARLGESWVRGVLVLAWDHVRSATHHIAAGQNVVLHEFAHQLDAEEGAMDGAPDLGSHARYVSWARVLGDEYKELSEQIHAGGASDIDPYGATNPPEFFAVVTEMFFERPRQMRKQHPQLYAELLAFYRQDPATLVEDADEGKV